MCKKVDLKIEVNIEFQIKEGFLSEELMDAYEEHFHEVSNDLDFDRFETREEKHEANIGWYLIRGETDFIEGYGKVDDFIEKSNITLTDAEKY
ncbi:hypothetical protein [Arcobacter sp.]|uniref:hypothetical protein n=1 Tax=unclassified Arcobacter TaxID=2593671 RepID=UPI003B005BA9